MLFLFCFSLVFVLFFIPHINFFSRYSNHIINWEMLLLFRWLFLFRSLYILDSSDSSLLAPYFFSLCLAILFFFFVLLTLNHSRAFESALNHVFFPSLPLIIGLCSIRLSILILVIFLSYTLKLVMSFQSFFLFCFVL